LSATQARFAALRFERNLTQRDVARIIGCTPQAVAIFERGSRAPRRATIERYAAALGVPVDALAPTADPGARIEAVASPPPKGGIPDLVIELLAALRVAEHTIERLRQARALGDEEWRRQRARILGPWAQCLPRIDDALRRNGIDPAGDA
jgi:transcriptional regulator with XRE-family HTH domain